MVETQNVFRMERFQSWLPLRVLLLVFSVSSFTVIILTLMTLKLQLLETFPRLDHK